MHVVGVFLDQTSNLFLADWSGDRRSNDERSDGTVFFEIGGQVSSSQKWPRNADKERHYDYVYNDLPIDYNDKEVRVGLGVDGLVKLSVFEFFLMKLNFCYPRKSCKQMDPMGRFIWGPFPTKKNWPIKSLASMRSWDLAIMTPSNPKKNPQLTGVFFC